MKGNFPLEGSSRQGLLKFYEIYFTSNKCRAVYYWRFIYSSLSLSLSLSTQYTRNNSPLFEWFSIKFIHNVAANIYWPFRSKKISIKTRRDNINILPYPLRIIILFSSRVICRKNNFILFFSLACFLFLRFSNKKFISFKPIPSLNFLWRVKSIV